MRIALCLLLASLLLAQETENLPPSPLRLHTWDCSDWTTRIQLVSSGCWDGLLLSVAQRPALTRSKASAQATVEVWDLIYREPPRQEAFNLYLKTLRQSLSKAMAVPPASHGSIELAELMASDPSNPQKLDLEKVQSLQNRFNRMPPPSSLYPRQPAP
jgi:hypothetical protein